MATSFAVLRLILHICSTLLLILSTAFILSAILTTAWQTYDDVGTQEQHMHGLFYDYTFAKRHVSGRSEPEWHWRYKFGQSVEGDEDHRWKPYQYNSLILFCTSAFLSFVAIILSYMAPYFISVALIWAFISVWPPLLTLSGIILFFATASLPENNHVFTDRRLELDIGYSFYLALAATIILFIGLTTIIGAALLDVLLLRRGERPSLRETYTKVSTRGNADDSQNDPLSVDVKKQSQITTV